jgi:chromosome segregation ATPase
MAENVLPQYPLEQVLDVKRKRSAEAEKVVAEKKRALEREQEKLKTAQEARDKVKTHYDDKLTQFRQLLDEGTTTDKIQQSKVYIKIVEEKLRAEQEKVKKQQSEVDNAQAALNVAREEWKMRQKEVDKIETHREEWLKEALQELLVIEIREQDELGSIIHQNSKMRS